MLLRQSKSVWIVPFFCLAILSGCGYHYAGQEQSSAGAVLIQIPYIAGDPEASLNNELVYQCTASGEFTCVQSGGDLIVQVEILKDEHDRIGFRYDRDNAKGHLEKNLLGVEDRRFIVAKVFVVDAVSGRHILEPKTVYASIDYDYTDPGSPRDLLFGQSVPMIQFSLGQLDSREGSHDAAARPLFQKLAQKIVTELLDSLSLIQEN